MEVEELEIVFFFVLAFSLGSLSVLSAHMLLLWY